MAGIFAVANDHAFGGALDHHVYEFALVLDVLLEAALLDLVERRLGDVDVVALDQLRHVAEEEGQQQGADVRAVDVGVGHEDDLAVADLGGIEVVFADAAAERGDHGADFFVAQHLVVAGLFDVEDLALERQDGLEAAIAALLGGAACAFTLDEVEFAAVGIALGAVGQLAGQAAAVEGTLAPGEVAGLARGLAGACSFNGLVDDLAGDRRILLEEHAEALVDEGLHGAGDVGVELALGLAFELRLRQLDADHRDQAFAHVVAAQVLLHVFEESERLADGVDGARERGAEAGEVRAAVDGVDVVGKAEDRFGVAVVVLQRDFDLDVVALRFHHDRLVVQHGLAAVEMLDELGDAAGVAEFGAASLAGLGIGGALVGERDFKALVEEGEFAQTLGQGVVVVFGGGEDGLVGQEVDLGAAPLAGAGLAQLAGGNAAAEIHLPGVAVAPDLDIEFLAERVHATHADAVQAAGNFVGGGIELAAGMELGEHHLHGGHPLAIGKRPSCRRECRGRRRRR